MHARQKSRACIFYGNVQLNDATVFSGRRIYSTGVYVSPFSRINLITWPVIEYFYGYYFYLYTKYKKIKK